jgi:CDP-paratose 2-epimerase
MQESIRLCEKITGNKMKVRYNDVPRRGDHVWWVSDVAKFKADYPGWGLTVGVEGILAEMYENRKEDWAKG